MKGNQRMNEWMPLTTTSYITVHDFSRYSVRSALGRMVFSEKVQDASFRITDFSYRNTVNVLDESWINKIFDIILTEEENKKFDTSRTVSGWGGQDTIRCEFEIKILPSEESIHQRDHLQNELVLTQVVTVLEYGHVLLAAQRRKRQTGRHQLGFE
jgi:hypothetical protein